MERSTSRVKQRTGSYPRVHVEGDGRGVVSQAGAVLLVETVRKTGLDSAISTALAPWGKARAVQDPGKIRLDMALAVALGGDCLSDVTLLLAEPAMFGPVASDPTVSRLVDTLAGSGKRALTAIRRARAQVREHVWALAGDAAADRNGQVIVDLDAVLVGRLRRRRRPATDAGGLRGDGPGDHTQQRQHARLKLKRLVERGILIKAERGLFTQPCS